MSCRSFTLKHALSLLIIIFTGIRTTASSTDCECPQKFQNARCLKDNGCRLQCDEGYWGNLCQFGRFRLTKKEGWMTDGGSIYPSNSKRMWLIEAENGTNATIHFHINELKTECNWDHLYIFDGDSVDSPQLAAFSGDFIRESTDNNSSSALIPQEIVAKSGKAYIYFYSDANVEKPGFNISYSIVQNCPCSSRGRCNAAGLCLCDPGWSGTICDIKIVNCSHCTNGICNKTLGHCICNPGFTGVDCSQPINSSYWTSISSSYSGDIISARASHSSAIIGDWMWVYSGYTSKSLHNGRPHQALYKYNLKEKTWHKVKGRGMYSNTSDTWGHTMIAYKDKLIIFGGESSKGIGRTLAIFNTTSSRWSLMDSFYSVGVTSHTATLVDHKMIVIFGLSKTGLYPNVQEYDIVKSEWKIVKVNPTNLAPRCGHSSVYDPSSRKIYVYGGVSVEGSEARPTDTLAAYDPYSDNWTLLSSSGFKHGLHSAVILDGMMLVYGGNPYINQNKNPTKCHSSTLLSYNFACQQWKSEELPQLPRKLARYGHTAVVKERTMYVFGGFNGALFNDVLTYTHGDCNTIFSETDCIERYFSAGCYWLDGRCVNRGSLNSSHCPVKYVVPCSEFKTCEQCTWGPAKCGWSGKDCQVNGTRTCPPNTKDRCSFYRDCHICSNAECHWDGKKCQKGKKVDCSASCGERLDSLTCVDTKAGSGTSSCTWCENIGRCSHPGLYTISYPYGQCLEWINVRPGNQATCESKISCQDCHTLPGCGWCEGSQGNGVGQCRRGGDAGPSSYAICKNWNFVGCPACQCNGHSNCSTYSNVCLACVDNTMGKNCEKCAPGYFGDPRNGAKCKPCQCNGHGDSCNSSTGKCECNMQGVEGDHCQKCDRDKGYKGNATNGGSCYLKLTPGYIYKIDVFDKTIINFICSPNQSDKDTNVKVDVEYKDKFSRASLNISYGSDIREENFLYTNIDLSSEFQEQFSKDQFDFGSNDFHFKIYMYDIPVGSLISIAIHQPSDHGIDLLQFFIIFLACFIGLLILAVIFWKAKASYDAFRSSRRRNVEMVYMTNRPFAKVPIHIEKPGYIPMKNKPSPLTSEVCYGNKAAVATVLIRLPICAQTQNADGAGALCLGSTLISLNENHGSKMMSYMKNVKRRRNPFRSSPA